MARHHETGRHAGQKQNGSLMGYTHTWSYVPDDTRFVSTFPRIRDDAAIILKHLAATGFELAGPNGDGGEPIARQRLQADSGSWFSWAFCKTNRLPYDLAVMAVLLRTHQLVPELLALGSTGSWDQEWRPARDLLDGLFDAVTSQSPLTDASRGPETVRAAAQHS